LKKRRSFKKIMKRNSSKQKEKYISISKIKNKIEEIFELYPEEKIFKEILDILLKETKSKIGIFGYIDKEENWVCLTLKGKILKECDVKDKSFIFPKERWGGFWGKAMLSKKPAISNNKFKVPKGHLPIFNAIDVPVLYKGKLIGNILLSNKKENYNEGDLNLLVEISKYLSPILNYHLEKKEEEIEKKKIVGQFLQAQKMEAIGLLAGGIAHDFNNTLSVIMGNAEILLKKLGRDFPYYNNLEEIYNASKNSSEIVKQLLAISKKQVINLKVLNLNDEIEKNYKVLKKLIGENIKLTFIPSKDLKKIEMDPGQINQILINLVINSKEAIKDNGEILIETKNINIDEDYCKDNFGFMTGEYVLLSISDSGSGIKRGDLNHIFDAFFTTKEKGTGLGLSTVYGIVKQNNGFINVYSEEGKGTTFKIYIPISKEMKREKKEEKIYVNGFSGMGEEILVVEDELSILNLLKIMLEDLNLKPLLCSNAKDAICEAKSYKGKIPLIITDLIMPEMNGKELVEKIKNFQKDIKVIYMSGYTLRFNIK